MADGWVEADFTEPFAHEGRDFLFVFGDQDAHGRHAGSGFVTRQGSTTGSRADDETVISRGLLPMICGQEITRVTSPPMKSFLAPLVALSLATAAVAAAPEYKILNRYKVDGEAGGFDYLRVDATARRLYIAHEKRVDVLDADTGARIGQVGPTTRAHGVALVPELNHGFATSGVDDLITMFDLKTLATLKQVKSPGTNPDAIEYDPESKHIFVGAHGSGD